MRKEPYLIKLVIPTQLALCLPNQSTTPRNGPLDYLENFTIYTFEFTEYTEKKPTQL